MSLLLDALRRAAASSRREAVAEHGIAPRRDDMTLDPAPDAMATDAPGEPQAARAVARGPEPAAEVPGLSLGSGIPGEGDVPLEPGRSGETASRREWTGERTAPPADGDATRAASTLLNTRGGGRRRGRGVLPLLALALVVPGGMAGVGWWYYSESLRTAEEGLAAYEPTADPLVELPSGQASAAEPAASGDAGAVASGGEARTAADGAAASGGSGQTDAGEMAAADIMEDTAVAGTGEADAAETAGEPAPAAAAEDAAAGADGAPSATGAAAEAEAGGGANTQAAADTDAQGAQDDDGGRAATRAAQPMVQAGSPAPLIGLLRDGYAALRAGELDVALRAYREAARHAPDNRDVLLGLATIAQRRGEPERAAGLYRRILADHPRDPHARAGLAALSGTTRPRRGETELKALLRDQPDAPSLHFALGNLYAAESRWSDAQQAFFEAYRAEPENPEYAYNLAVALDHLEQRRAALTHYRQALDRISGETAAGFSIDAVRRRIAQLQ